MPIINQFVDEEIISERKHQIEKWGEQNHLQEKWLVILQEEIGEMSKGILGNNGYVYREELIQVCAVAMAMLECWDRQVFNKKKEREE